MRSYYNLLTYALKSGIKMKGRNGMVRAVFGGSMQFDTMAAMPMLSLRRLNWNNIVHEIIWYLRGESNVRYLRDNGVTIWDQWADDEGELGPVYGVQWRRWRSPDALATHIGFIDRTIDQIKQVETELEYCLQREEYSRRLMVSAWNVADLPEMRLPPCPFAFQLHLAPIPSHLDRRYRADLHMTVYQRSCDLFVGAPHDIAGHALLLRMFAEAHSCRARMLTMHIGDAHLYESHVDATEILLERALRYHALPLLESRENHGRVSVLEFNAQDFSLLNYSPMEPIKVEVHA